MKRFKNVICLLLACCTAWSMVRGMKEGPKIADLVNKVKKKRISEEHDPDQSAYFYKIDDKLYRLLLMENLKLANSNDYSSLCALIKNKDVTIDQKRTAFACALKNIIVQKKIVFAFLKTGLDLNFYFKHKDKKGKGDSDDVELDEYYLTPLLHAVKDISINVIKKLLECGADINFASPYKDGEYSNMTALLWAANLGLEEKVRYLGIECGANPNIAQSKYAGKDAGMTALHWAVSYVEYEIIKILLKCKGIDVNSAQPSESRDYAGGTPLHLACKIGNFAIVKMLFDAGANIAATLSFGRQIGKTPLFLAIEGGNVDIVNFLLEMGADVNQKQPSTACENSGQTPLGHACRYKNLEIIDALLDAGAKANIAQTKQARYNAGMTPLHWAASSGNAKVIPWLVDDHAANVNAALCAQSGEDIGITALHLAVVKDDIEAVSALLKYKKINIDAVQQESVGKFAGYTPLHYACERGFYKIAILLLNYKAGINVKLNERADDYSEATPLTLVLLLGGIRNKQKAELVKKKTKLVRLLLSRGAIVSQVYLCSKIKNNQNAALQKLIKNVVDRKTLEDLRTFAIVYENTGALNVIKEKQAQIDAAQSNQYVSKQKSKTQRKNKRKNNRKRSKKKKCKKQTGSCCGNSQVLDKHSDKKEEDLVELFYDLKIDDKGRIVVNFAQQEDIKVLEDSDVQYKFVYSGLESFGGKVLTITVQKIQKPLDWLHLVGQFGFDLSQRVLTGTRKKLGIVRKTQPIGEWNVHPATLQNPKMNDSNDPTHAFPLFVEKNCCRWAVKCDTEDITRYDKRDLPRGKKLSDYTEKLVFYIPGIIELAKDGGSGIETIIGCFEYVILIPKDKVTAENRPLCVHRFFRPSK